MSSHLPAAFPKSLLAALAGTVLIGGIAPTEARVTRIVIDQTLNNLPPTGVQTVAYQTINGRAFGELCISGCQGAANNTIITDLGLAPHVPSASPVTPGAIVVQYVASFSIVKPTDNSNISGILWHDVPNRGGRIVINIAERGLGDVGLSSAWQGDNAGATGPGSATTVPSYASSTTPVTTGLQNNEWVKTPVATGTTGLTIARVINRSGAASQALNEAWSRSGVTDAIVAMPMHMLNSNYYEFGDGQANVAPSFEGWHESRPPVVATLVKTSSGTKLLLLADHALPNSDTTWDATYKINGQTRNVSLPITRQANG